MIWFRLPLPPSLNNCYVNNRRTGGRFPSKKLKDFKREFNRWGLMNYSKILEVREMIKSMHFNPEKVQLRLDRYFVFHRSDIFTKDNRVKKMDVSNKIKVFDDAISDAIGIDDSRFFMGTEEKVYTLQKENEQGIVKFSLIRPRDIVDLSLSLGSWKDAWVANK